MPGKEKGYALLAIQSSYMLVTALWALVHIESFMMVTGPKTDIWLVKTFSTMLLALSAGFFYTLYHRAMNKTVMLFALTNAIALFLCELIYAGITEVISKIYLADAGIQALFITGWTYRLIQSESKGVQR